MSKSLTRVVVSVIGSSVLSFVTVLPAGASTPSAASLLASAVRNAIASGAVHEVDHAKLRGVTLTAINDIGSNEGRQIITISSGASTEVIAFDSMKKAYTKGNELGLKSYFGFPASDAVKYAGKWMEAVPSDQAWTNITNSTTLTSDFGTNIHIHDPALSTKLVTINGVRAYAISGTEAATANSPAASVTVYVSDSSKVLPLRVSETAKGESVTVNWSNWGETLALKAPTTSVPLP
jgi:hypothetical protein